MKKKDKEEFKINLQLFADGDEGDKDGDTTPPANNEDGKGEGEGEEKDTFNQEEVDGIVAEKLAAEKLKLEKEYKEKLKLDRAEEKRLAGLSEEEREKEILKKELEDFKAEKADFQREKLELQITKELAEKGLPVKFAELLVGEDAETSFDNIKKFEESWTEALEKAVIEKLKNPGLKGEGSKLGDAGVIGKRLAAQKKESEVVVKDNPYF